MAAGCSFFATTKYVHVLTAAELHARGVSSDSDSERDSDVLWGASNEGGTVLVEIIRDSKSKYFFQRSWIIIMVEISRSRIIRITNYSARTYMCFEPEEVIEG